MRDGPLTEPGQRSSSTSRFERDRAKALQALDSSLRRALTQALRGGREDAFLMRKYEALRECQIEPIEVQAIASPWAQRYARGDTAVRTYIALARSYGTWLLYSPQTGEFAKAFGRDPGRPLSLLGFASTDALAEWVG